MNLKNIYFYKKGLNGFTLKCIALVLMTLDHLYKFFGDLGIPLWFKYIGRLSAPIFMFLLAWGLHFTKSRRKYLIRLYAFSLLMGIADALTFYFSPYYGGSPVFGNIFATLFLIALITELIQNITSKEADKQELVRGIYTNSPLAYRCLFSCNKKAVIVSAILAASMFVSPLFLSYSYNMALYINVFLPSPILCEGGIWTVITGVLLCISVPSKKCQIIVFALMSLFFLPFDNLTFEGLFYENYQWMMIFAVFPMMLYNKQKGKEMKYFFYLYYPAHIYILWFFKLLFLRSEL